MYPCDANVSIIKPFVIPAIIIGFLLCGVIIFSFVYNSPVFAENVCRDAHVNFGVETRIVLTSDYAYCQVFVDNNWIDICDSNIGFYCTTVN